MIDVEGSGEVGRGETAIEGHGMLLLAFIHIFWLRFLDLPATVS